MYELRQWEL